MAEPETEQQNLRPSVRATARGPVPRVASSGPICFHCLCPSGSQVGLPRQWSFAGLCLTYRFEPRKFSAVSRQNLIRAENGAIRLVPRIEKRAWTRSRVALRSAKVLFRRGPGHMRCSYLRMSEKLVRFRQPDRNDDATRRVAPATGRDQRLCNELCSSAFPSPVRDACDLRGTSEHSLREVS
jgi:hypothetical protein